MANDDLKNDYELPPHQRQSETSVLAAREVAHKFGARQRQHLAFYREAGDKGLTDDEVQIKAQQTSSQQVSVRGKLAEKGYLRQAGVQRKTRCDRWAEVWIIVDKEFNWEDFRETSSSRKSKVTVEADLLRQYINLSSPNPDTDDNSQRLCQTIEDNLLRLLGRKGLK